MLPRTLVSTALLGNVFKCFEPSFVSTKCCCMAVPPLRPSVLLSKPQASASASAGCRWVRGREFWERSLLLRPFQCF